MLYPKGEKFKVILTNKPNSFNKKLIQYFKDNLSVLNKRQLAFEWIIVYPDEIELYKQQNITRFPCLIANENVISGTNAIINYLSPRNVPAAYKKYDSEHEVKDYLMKELKAGNNDDDMDESDAFAKDLHRRMTEMNKARSRMGQHTLDSSNSDDDEPMLDRRVRFADQHRDDNLDEPRPILKNSAKPSELVKNSPKRKDMEDDLMMKFWQNNEETEI